MANFFTIEDEKQYLRKAYRGGKIPNDMSKLYIHLRDFLSDYTNKSIGFYHAINGEIDLWSAVKNHPKKALPVIINDKEMVFRSVSDNTIYKTGPFDIQEPQNGDIIVPDIILMPLLCFDRKGGRLGKGKGYYDRYCKMHPTIIRLGIAHSEQETENVPMAPHDLYLHYLISEKETLSF